MKLTVTAQLWTANAARKMHHMTEAQLLAMARQFYSGARPRGALFGT